MRKDKKEIKNGLVNGILSAIVPHIGCIAFIVITLLGISTGSVLLKKFVLASWSFPLLILISFLLASILSIFYFKKNCCENKIKYISVLLLSILFVNGLLFYVVFPWVANVGGRASALEISNLSVLKIKVGIPCSGHASLIIYELKSAGIAEAVYDEPDMFSLYYDSSKISKETILGLSVLKEFNASEI